MNINDMQIYAHPITKTTVEIRYAADGIAVSDEDWVYPYINGQRVYLNDEAEETVIIDLADALALGITIDY